MNAALRIVYYCLIFKLLLGAWLPLFFDESYYWFWGQNLQTSYYDHPPFVAWLYYAGRLFDGFGHAARWPGIIMTQLTTIVWLYVLRDYLNDKKLKLFALMMSFWPMFGFAAIIITPDVPMFFFWGLSLLCMKRTLKDPTWFNYAAFGLSLGLGGSSKYLMIFFIPCLLIYVSWAKLWSKIHWSKLSATIFMGLVGISPVLLWNYQNNWDSILFQINHGLGEEVWKINWTTDYILGQIFIIFPPILYFALKSFKENKLLHSFAWFPLLFFVYSSTKGSVQANWPMMAYPAIGALALINTEKFRWLKISSAFWILLTVTIFSNAFYYWVPEKHTEFKIREIYEYQPYKKIAESYSPLFGTTFQNSSYLSYLTRKKICKLRDYRRKDFFDYLDCSIPKEKRYFLFIVKDRVPNMPEWAKDHKMIQRIQLDAGHDLVEMEQP